MPTNNAEFVLENIFNVRDKVVETQILDDSVAVITGGGSGLGLMAAQALAVNGARVYIIGRTEAKLKRAVEAHGRGIEGSLIALVGDVSRKDEIRPRLRQLLESRIVHELESREEMVDILINNAGIYSNSQKPEGSNAEELKNSLFEAGNATFENWTEVYATNVAAIYFVTTAFLPLLQRASDARPGQSSTVINISSINGMIKESLGRFATNSAKAATIHLTKMLAVEIAKCKLSIRVNSIAPGLFPSELTTGTSDDSQKSPALPAGTCGDISAGRPGNDVDMASAILFAATNQYVNGQIIAVDGGYLVKYGTL
ncbi:hypothetical protein L249_3156 [Ophiocordyceps polyrhachis-furcata BCC 54312]|uniref:Uncharacterized protein n=1 Tax=Ophiocordyceps polyrhachis-furcata BCC 54312 TaxID=1330021 RepID=A0A367LS48_9HYPO|nr:hypothetical protein L249_3156 [Ophiocordyceps polyrhachis-furcata BCC 54312]